MHTEILILAGTASSGLLALSINRGLKMRDDKRPLAELLWYAGGLIPMAAVCLYWASMGDQPVMPQRIILFIIGAAIGGCALLGAGEWFRPTSAIAQSGGAVPPINNYGPSINTNNQSGGQNTINNFATPARHVLPNQKQKFLENMPKGSSQKIAVRIQDGSNDGRQYAGEVADLFRTAGFQPIGTDAANTLPGGFIGLIIEHSDPMPQTAKAIGDAFTAAAIPFSFAKGPWAAGTDAFRIVIWPAQ
jgi:hypothetical protein